MQLGGGPELPGRLRSVLQVVYLIFNEGYAATSGDQLVRADLCAEAVRLGRLLAELMPDDAEVWGLLALMELHEARRAARVDEQGRYVALTEQDPERWDRSRLAAGMAALDRALRLRNPGQYQLQAAITARPPRQQGRCPMTAGPEQRQVSAADVAVRAAGLASGQWYGHGDYESLSWSARRAAADRALSELDDAARAVLAARVALAQEIRAEADRQLAADASRCSAQWGACPEHGNTLASSGGRSWCCRPSCGRTWPGSRVSQHCDEPAAVLVADEPGAQLRLCAGHWADAQVHLVGATVVRVLAVEGGR